MTDPREALRTRAHALFCDFIATTSAATSPAEHRQLWDDWAARELADGSPVTASPATLGGVECEWIFAPGTAADAPVVLFVHGGGFSSGSTRSHRPLMAAIAHATRARVLGLNYRLSPESRFPAQIEDVVAVYRALLEGGIPAGQVAFAGDSAGGGLAFAALLRARELAVPLPVAAIGIGPWVDLAVTGASMVTNAATDPAVKRDGIAAAAAVYLDGRSPYDPLASPIYADLCGLPPMLVQVSTTEAFLDDGVRLVGRAVACGVAARLSQWPGMVHGWHQFASFLPEAQQALAEIASFLRGQPTWQAS